MVPEDQLVAVGGEILLAKLDEGGKCGRVRHRASACIVHQLQKAALLDLIDLVFAAADDIVVPAAASAGVDDQIHVVGNFGGSHFLQVGSRHFAAGLKVGAAQVDHDRHDIFAVSNDLRALFTGPGNHFTVQVSDRAAVGPGTFLRPGGCI